MEFKIIETTDNKFLGVLIEKELLIKGNEIVLCDFTFEIDDIIETTSMIKISNANYIITLEGNGE